MKEIQMVDLHTQYLHIKSEVDEAINHVIESTAFIKGKDVALFQQELSSYMGVKHTIACGNGTDALQLALMSLNLMPGDEVITTPFTFISTIEVIKLLGLQPILVDVREDTFNLDPSLLDKAISSKTRAIVPVHLFGQCAKMDAIMDIASEHNLFVIEDNAQALGADFIYSETSTQKAGTIGDIGTTSFFPSKNLGGYGDGGAIFTNDDKLGEMLKAMANHGMKRRYYYDYVGVNSRLDTLQAAILRVKLKHLENYHHSRQRVADFYDNALSGLQGLKLPVRSAFSSHVFHQYTIQVSEGSRDSLKNFLHEKGIPSMIYYPFPLHMQHAYKDLGYYQGDLPVAEELSTKVLSLPMHTELEEQQLTFITDHIHEYFNS